MSASSRDTEDRSLRWHCSHPAITQVCSCAEIHFWNESEKGFRPECASNLLLTPVLTEPVQQQLGRLPPLFPPLRSSQWWDSSCHPQWQTAVIISDLTTPWALWNQQLSLHFQMPDGGEKSRQEVNKRGQSPKCVSNTALKSISFSLPPD